MTADRPRRDDDRPRDHQRRSRRAGQEPAGIERARQRADAPPRALADTGGKKRKAQEPQLADDAPVDMRKGVQREIERAASSDEQAHRYNQHLTVAFAALDERDGRRALPHLQFVKSRLPRIGPVREALGVALYLAEDYRSALTELQAFRRLTGSVEQHHLIADCLRAVDEGTHRIPELVKEMEAAEESPPEAALYEARIVWASWLADAGDVGAGRAVLRPLLGDEPNPVEEHHLRLWYVAGDLAERGGDDADATTHFERVAAVVEDFFDTDDRLAALR